MASNEIGFSFAPGSQSIPVGGSRVSGGPQSAVQVKSFTLPNRFVPGQIAPQALLQSPGGGGGLNVDILRRLMQMFAPQGQQPGVPTLGQPGASAPRPIPGGIGPFPQGTGMHTQPVPSGQDVPQTPGQGAPPRIVPGEGPKVGPDYNPYTNPANYAPAPPEPVTPINIPAPADYHFGTTPPAPSPVKSPLASKFDDIEGFTF